MSVSLPRDRYYEDYVYAGPGSQIRCAGRQIIGQPCLAVLPGYMVCRYSCPDNLLEVAIVIGGGSVDTASFVVYVLAR